MTMAKWKTITRKTDKGTWKLLYDKVRDASFVVCGLWSHLGCPARKATMFKSSRYLWFAFGEKIINCYLLGVN